MSKYSVDYFIAKFKAIPEVNWLVRDFKLGNAACALGHCGVRYESPDKLFWTREGEALKKLVHDALRGRTIMSINDFATELFPQPTPKQRVLAALRFIKSMEISNINNLIPIESHL